jgi:low affinity Fe/Cu permease
MATSATTRKANGGSHAAKNGKSAHAAKRNVGAQVGANDGVADHPQLSHKPGAFTIFAQKIAQLAGRPGTFMLSAMVIVVWAVTGPLFGYSDTWQLVINTGTTIVTFLMVFLIQHTQNRDSLAFQVKLDELIIKLHGAGNHIAGAEDLCDEDLQKLHETYRARAAHAHATLEKRHAPR